MKIKCFDDLQFKEVESMGKVYAEIFFNGYGVHVMQIKDNEGHMSADNWDLSIIQGNEKSWDFERNNLFSTGCTYKNVSEKFINRIMERIQNTMM